MIKRFIKWIAYSVYEVGFSEFKRKKDSERNAFLNKSMIMAEDVFIDSKAIIQNSQGNKHKIRVGKKSVIMGYLMLFKHGGEITIGEYSLIGSDSIIWSAKKITIGNRVLISHNVNIHDNISHPLDSKERHADFIHIRLEGFQEKIDLREKEIVIEDDVWIGFNSTILKGVRIGKGAIIGAGTLVDKNIPPFAVVVGNPFRIVKYVS